MAVFPRTGGRGGVAVWGDSRLSVSSVNRDPALAQSVGSVPMRVNALADLIGGRAQVGRQVMGSS